MNRFDTIHYNYRKEYGLLTEEELLLEGKIRDLLKSGVDKIKSIFGTSDDNTATQVMSKIVKDQISQVSMSRRLSPQQQNQLTQVMRALPETPDVVIKVPAFDYSKLSKDLSDVLNQRMLDMLGDWWLQHVVDEQELAEILKTFQSTTQGSTGMKVAMPLDKFGKPMV